MYIVELGYDINRNGEVINPDMNIVKGSLSSTGYLRSCIKKNNKNIHYFFHQLQAFKKFGDEIFNSYCVRHLNGDKTDNTWDNIVLGSHSDNMQDIPKEIRLRSAKKSIFLYKKIFGRRCYQHMGR